MKTLLLASAMIVSVASGALAWDTTINNGGRGGTGYGGAGGAGGMGGTGGAGGSSASQSISAAAASANAAAQSRSGSASTLTVAPGAIGSGNSGGSAAVNAAPGFGLPSFGGGSQCGTVGFGIAISPSGGGAFGPAWESTNCRNYNIALTMIASGKAAEGWELMAMITPEAGKVLSAHPAAMHSVAYAPTRTFDCDKVRHDTGHGRMSDEDMAIYRRCH